MDKTTSKKGEFKIELVNPESPILMEALGIDPDRCQELCNIVSDVLHESGEERLTEAQVLSRASEKAQSQNETYIIAEIVGSYKGRMSNYGGVTELLVKHMFDKYREEVPSSI